MRWCVQLGSVTHGHFVRFRLLISHFKMSIHAKVSFLPILRSINCITGCWIAFHCSLPSRLANPRLPSKLKLLSTSPVTSAYVASQKTYFYKLFRTPSPTNFRFVPFVVHFHRKKSATRRFRGKSFSYSDMHELQFCIPQPSLDVKSSTRRSRNLFAEQKKAKIWGETSLRCSRCRQKWHQRCQQSERGGDVEPNTRSGDWNDSTCSEMNLKRVIILDLEFSLLIKLRK